MSGFANEPTPESYLETGDHDYLARMIYQLLNELWVTRDRVAVLEHLLEEKRVLDAGEIDTCKPSGSFAEALELMRDVMVENVVGAPYSRDLKVEDLKKIGKKWRATQR